MSSIGGIWRPTTRVASPLNDSERGARPSPGSGPRAAAPFLTAAWRWLALVNFDVDPDVLLPYVPAGTELDPWDGSFVMSLVGFRFLDTRLRGFAIPGHRDFDEVNLRFYVSGRGPDGPRRGVVFIKEIVPRRAIAFVARAVYGENYISLPMRHAIEIEGPDASDGRVSYGWRSGDEWGGLEATISGRAAVPPPGTEAAFITQHDRGYSATRSGDTLAYRVAHPPWRVWSTAGARVDGDLASLYGRGLAPYLRRAPRSAFVAVGSRVEVYPGTPLSSREPG